jgi:hypothetical protein
VDGDEHPLARTLAGVAASLPAWQVWVGRPEGPAWTRYDDACEERSVARRLDELDRHYRGGLPVAAHSLVGRIAGPPATIMAAAVFRERRLPLVAPDGLALRWVDEGHAARADTVAIWPPRMAVLPDDPAAGLPGVTTVADLGDLQRELAAQVHRLAGPLVELASRLGRRGRRALWQRLADALAAGYVQAGRAIGDTERARAETAATLGPDAPGPLRLTPDWLEVEHGGAQHLFKRKSVCCLVYRTPEYSDEYCTTCPLLQRDEAIERLRRHVATLPA